MKARSKRQQKLKNQKLKEDINKFLVEKGHSPIGLRESLHYYANRLEGIANLQHSDGLLQPKRRIVLALLKLRGEPLPARLTQIVKKVDPPRITHDRVTKFYQSWAWL